MRRSIVIDVDPPAPGVISNFAPRRLTYEGDDCFEGAMEALNVLLAETNVRLISVHLGELEYSWQG